MWKKIKLNLEYACSTWFGLLRLGKTCDKWDKKLNELIDKYGDNAVLSAYKLHLGNNKVWIANRFYCYGSYYGKGEFLPKRKTAIRLALIEDRLRLEKEAKQQEKYETELNNIK